MLGIQIVLERTIKKISISSRSLKYAGELGAADYRLEMFENVQKN